MLVALLKSICSSPVYPIFVADISWLKLPASLIETYFVCINSNPWVPWPAGPRRCSSSAPAPRPRPSAPPGKHSRPRSPGGGDSEGTCKVGPQFGIAKLVNIIPISLWFMVYITIVNGGYRPTYSSMGYDWRVVGIIIIGVL